MFISDDTDEKKYTGGDYDYKYSTNKFIFDDGVIKSTNQSINNSLCMLEFYLKPTGMLTFDFSLGSEEEYDYFVFAITRKNETPTFDSTERGNSLYYFKFSGYIDKTCMCANLSSYLDDSSDDLRINFVYFKDYSVREHSDTLNIYSIITSPLPIHVSCFLKGTPILTDQGITPINRIIPCINTINKKKIVAVTKSIMATNYLVRIEKDAFGDNIPSEETITSPEHRILYDDKMTKANKILDMNDKVHKIEYNGDTLYNVLMENYDKMTINNLVVETLHPKNILAKLYSGKHSEEEKNQLIQNINEKNIR
jgi:hypothetical protein